jgi:nucleoid DNA-binding protein
MAATVGVAMLRRLVANHCDLPREIVDKVLDAHETVLRHELATRAKVRFLDGWLVNQDVKPTRRRHPKTGEIIDLPASAKVIYKESKTRTAD